MRPRVLLAEDHPTVAMELIELLTVDYDVVATVEDGKALVDVSGRIVPDVIVCDIAMPGGSGIAAADTILAARPDARIIFVTVQDSRAVIRRALDLGARGYVLKCDAGEELASAVRAVMAGGYYLSANARLCLGGA